MVFLGAVGEVGGCMDEMMWRDASCYLLMY